MSPAPPAHRDKSGAPLGTGKQSLLATEARMYDMERDRIGVWGSGDGQSASKVSGLDRLKHPALNKVPIHSYHSYSLYVRVIRLGHGCTRDTEVFVCLS